jgi:hypothetical protein
MIEIAISIVFFILILLIVLIVQIKNIYTILRDSRDKDPFGHLASQVVHSLEDIKMNARTMTRLSSESNESLKAMSCAVQEVVHEEEKSVKMAEEKLAEDSKTSFVEEPKDKKERMIRPITWYKAKIQEYLDVKEKTLKADKVILRQIGLSDKAFKQFIKPFKDKHEELKAKCQEKNRQELNDRFNRRVRR